MQGDDFCRIELAVQKPGSPVYVLYNANIELVFSVCSYMTALVTVSDIVFTESHHGGCMPGWGLRIY